MAIDGTKLRPANILVISGTPSPLDEAIEIAGLIHGEPAAQHVAVVHHKDAAGTWWGIEGRPGGVGQVDCTRYVNHPLTVSNLHQPLTETARYAIAVTMEAMLGTPYDWQAIAEDGAMALAFGLPDIWHEKIDGKLPGHIVCSSLAAYGYCKAGQPSPRPNDYRHVTPGDWEKFIFDRRYG